MQKVIFNCISDVFLSLLLKILEFFLFGNVVWNQGSQFKKKKSKMYFSVEILDKCLPTVKKYFQLHKDFFC